MKNNLLLLITTVVLLLTGNAQAQTPNYVPTNGLVGWWPFTGNANDESGNGNNGTVNGSTLTTDRFGNTNQAYSFDGVDDYISLVTINQLGISNSSFSISIWVNSSVFGANNDEDYIIGTPMWAGGSDEGVKIQNNPLNNINGIFSSSLGIGGQVYCFSNNSFSLNTWYNVLVTYNNLSGLFSMYIDGVFMSSSTLVGSPLANPYPFSVGAFVGPWIGQFLTGKTDDIGIWNRALTQQEITNLYNTSNGSSSCVANILQNDTAICLGRSVKLSVDTSNLAPDTILLSSFNITVNSFNNQIFNVTQGASYILEISGVYTTGTYCPSLVNDAAYQLPGYYGSSTAQPRDIGCAQSGLYCTANCPNNFYRPIPDVYNSNHTYRYYFSANSTTIEIGFNDAGAFGDNCGSLNAKLYRIAPNASYLWSTGATTSSITVTPTNTTKYYVTVSTSNGSCLDSITITSQFNTATITHSGNTTFCLGGSVTLTANGGTTYAWSNSSNNQSISVNNGGTYTVTVTDGNGCSATASQSVTVNQLPNNGVNTSGTTTFCSGGSVTLTSQGTGTYLWSNGSTNQSITVNQSGSYNVTVTSSNNCSASSSPINVTVNQTPTASITTNGNTIFCVGGSVTLTANGGSNYNWSSGGNNQSITVNNGGSYTVTVSNGNCTATATQSVTVNPNPTVTFSLPNLICNTSSSFTMNGNPSGGTYNGAGVSGNSFNASNAGLGLKQITYTYTDGNGCLGNASSTTLVYDTAGVVCTSYDTVTTYLSVTDTLKINVNLTGINPPNNTNTVLVYPNPAKDHLLVSLGNYTTMNGYTVKITNTLGQTVFNQPVNQQQFYIDLSTWGGAGIYILYILDTNNAVKSQKQIVLQ